jgi:hypothetical protein
MNSITMFGMRRQAIFLRFLRNHQKLWISGVGIGSLLLLLGGAFFPTSSLPTTHAARRAADAETSLYSSFKSSVLLTASFLGSATPVYEATDWAAGPTTEDPSQNESTSVRVRIQ